MHLHGSGPVVTASSRHPPPTVHVRPSPASSHRELAFSTAGESLSPGQHRPVSPAQQASTSLGLT